MKAPAHPVEPVPPARGPGRIIFLNGASCSGKSTLAKALQLQLDEPFLHVSSDHLVAAGLLPQRREVDGPFDWWHQMRPRFFAGFHRCLPALALAGNDLIVEHIIEFAAWRQDLARLLAGLDVFLVGVHCDLDQLDRRAQRRGDRRIGEGRTHVVVDGIHTFGPYDLEVDTTAGVAAELASSILEAWRRRTPPTVLQVTGEDMPEPRTRY
jgi:chloramphenicol 3-O phosphotransferase